MRNPAFFPIWAGWRGALEHILLFDKLFENHRNFGAVLGHLNRGVFILNEEGRVRVWNHAMEKITGLASSGAVEQDAGRLFAGMGVPAVSTAVAEVLKENRQKVIEGVRWRDEDGGAVFRVRLRPIVSEGRGMAKSAVFWGWSWTRPTGPSSKLASSGPRSSPPWGRSPRPWRTRSAIRSTP